LLIVLAGCQSKATETVKPAATAQGFSAGDLAPRTLERRAVEAVIWGTPAVNFDRMYQAMVHDAKAGEGSNKIVYWSRLFGWKNQTLTPNPDSIYLMAFFNTKDAGPVVLEIPPADGGSITGSVDDCWQTAIEDVGPAGVDKGKGGKYLILPPGLQRQTTRRLHPPAGIQLPGLCSLALHPQKQQRGRRHQSRRLRQADQALTPAGPTTTPYSYSSMLSSSGSSPGVSGVQ
jgi:hypothetical protein